MIAQNQTVRDLVVTDLHAAAVLDHLGIELDEATGLTIDEALDIAGLDPSQLYAELAHRRPGSHPPDASWTPEALMNHLIRWHHKPLRRVMPFIVELAAEVASDPNATAVVRGAERRIRMLYHHLDTHMLLEEGLLFPAIRKGGAQGFVATQAMRLARLEHEETTLVLAELRELTNDFELQPDATPQQRLFFRSLVGLRNELTTHMRLENEVLFPSVMRALERHAR